MNSDVPLIELKAISKSFSRKRTPTHSFWTALFGKSINSGGSNVLSEINLSIYRGETIGIIGRNGAGKSTLLQIITGVVPQTTGEKYINATIAAMLELGAGFNPEFTGLENIRLSLAMRGVVVSHENINKIIDFSELGAYINAPLKIYSSGMYAKLAFSVNIALAPDVLIVDEALSVGDVFFQAKCIKWMDDFRDKGGTVLFVTHDTYTVERICNRAILLNEGRILYDGPAKEAIKLYYSLGRKDGFFPDESLLEISDDYECENSNSAYIELKRDHITGNGDVQILGVRMSLGISGTYNYAVGEEVTWIVDLKLNKDIPSFDFGLGIRDKAGILLGGSHTLYSENLKGQVGGVKGDILRIEVQLKLDIAPGEYFIIVGAAKHFSLEDWIDYCTIWDGFAFVISGSPQFWGWARFNSNITVKNVREN